MIRAALAAVLTASASFAMAEAFSLALPVDCNLGETCYIQQYLDHDPGPGFRDFTCAGLSYNGHKGTDFGLATLENLHDRVAVRAAAPGTVTGLRDGMADRIYTGEDLDGRDCGNGVVIRHDDGWETQYCHLKRGSLAVTRGQSVETGDKLGLIGLSGRTEFPHLHLSVRRNGRVVDPFAPDGGASCGSDSTLWAVPITYTPGGLLDLGFADHVPDYADVKSGVANDAPLGRASPAMVGYGYAFGVRVNDVMEIVIDGPKGEIIRHRARLDKDQAMAFRAAGRKRPGAGWPRGVYTLSVTLEREGQALSQRVTRMTLR